MTADTPTSSEMRAPWITRLSTSRPTWSVPSGYAALPPACHTGGVKRRSSDCLAGSCGATQGAASAAPTTTSRISVPASAAGLKANRRHAREPDVAGADASYASVSRGSVTAISAAGSSGSGRRTARPPGS